MNLTIISRNIQTTPTTIIWNFEVSLADQNSFMNAYANNLPNPFPFSIETNSTSFLINSQINSQYQWIAYQSGSQNYIRVAWTDLSNLPTFGINDVTTISYSNTVNPIPTPNIIITHQAGIDSLNVVYRPVVFRCTAVISGATATKYIPPVVYCDIYLNGVYYKTISKTQFLNNNGTTPEYEFDLQDALQEVMTYNLPVIDGSDVLDFNNTYKKVFVKFRNAKYDVNGFIKSEQLEPIQATSSNQSAAGSGIQSNEIYVFNSTLQHTDNQNFADFLDSYRTGAWADGVYPMSKRPKYTKLCIEDSSYFPIINPTEIACLKLAYKLKGQSSFQFATYCYPTTPIVPTCIAPTLTSVEKLFTAQGDPYYKYIWSLNGFDYGVNGLTTLQISGDGGATWLNDTNTYNPTLLVGTTSADNIGVIGSNYIFRIKCSGNGCSNQVSNVVTTLTVNITPYQLQFTDGTTADKISNTIPFTYSINLINTNTSGSTASVQMSTDLGITWNTLYGIGNTQALNDTISTMNNERWIRVRNTDSNGNYLYSNILKAKTIP